MAKNTVPQPKLRVGPQDLDDLFNLGPEQAPEIKQGDVLTTLPFSLMDDFFDHQFHLVEGGRKKDFVEDIKANGIIQPIVVRPRDNGRFEILAGHNRRHCGEEAGLTESPVVIMQGLTDEQARIIAFTTNMRQRAFSELCISKQAEILAKEHSKLFSQGKRNDILAELEKLDNGDCEGENQTSSLLKKKSRNLTTLEKLSVSYDLDKSTIARYIRIHKLIQELKTRVDNREIATYAATDLSYLKESEQVSLNCCMELNAFQVDMKKASALRSYSEKNKLGDDNIYLILSGELGGRPKARKQVYAVKSNGKFYQTYFAGKKSEEVKTIIEQAVEEYFARRQALSAEQITEAEMDENSDIVLAAR